MLENVNLASGKQKDMTHYLPEVKESAEKEKYFLGTQTVYKTFSRIFTEVSLFQDVFTHYGVEQMKQIIRSSVESNGAISVQFCIPAIIQKNDGATNMERQHAFTTKAEPCNGVSDVKRVVDKAKKTMYALLENLQETGSGWSLSHCCRFDITIMLRSGVRGGRGSSNNEPASEVAQYAIKRCQGYQRKLANSYRAAILPRYTARAVSYTHLTLPTKA